MSRTVTEGLATAVTGLSDLFIVLLLVAAAVLAGLIAAGLFRLITRSVARRQNAGLAVELTARIRGPLRLLFPLLALALMQPLLPLPPALDQVYHDLVRILLIVAVMWTALRALAISERWLLQQFNVEVVDNLRARKIHTQVRVIRRIALTIVMVVGIAALLLTFEPVRQIGTTLLASAGILGLVVGFAAQKTLGLVVAGLQVALAQPIRIDDVVVLEGEWGRIEEITLTYVVVRIWDRRRLVVPVTYFIEKPFQNWTRVSADLLGSVFIYVDYTFPVPALREELRRILEASPLWDREVCVLQVTDSREQTLELRALMSAADSPTLWDLRCHVREALVEFVRSEHPDHLPRLRAEMRPQVD